MATQSKKPNKPDIPSSSSKSAKEVLPAGSQKSSSSWSVETVFWGLLLVTLGVLLLLGNLGIVTLDWANLWRLWPLAIIFAGLSLVKTRHWLWRTFTILFVLAALAVVVLVGTGVYSPRDAQSEKTQHQTVRLDRGVTRASVDIVAGASKLTIGSHSDTAIVDATLDSDNLELQKESRRDGETQKVRLSAENQRGVWFMRGGNTWDVTMSEKLPLDVLVDAGASSIDADFSKTQLQNLTIDSGASSVVLTLGSREMMQKVMIDSGASAITIRVPKDAGVKLMIDGGLSSKDLADLNEVSKDTYQTDEYDDAENKIELTADIGLASFTVERY